VDLDETLIPHGHNDLAHQELEFLARVQHAGIKLIIASNARRNIDPILKATKAPAVRATASSFKPLASYYRRIIDISGAKPAHIAMLGDRILNDIYGPNKAGFVTIYVFPFQKRRGLLHKWYVRQARKRAARRHHQNATAKGA
jgi:HAD superfamily phosphatase (TIGR01668 family)